MHQGMNTHAANRNSEPKATPEIINCGRRNPVELESIPCSVNAWWWKRYQKVKHERVPVSSFKLQHG